MDITKIEQLFNEVINKKISIKDAVNILKKMPFEDIGFANVDHHRSIRKGFPEVIFGQGKTSFQIIGIMKAMVLHENRILVTRIDKSKADEVCKQFPESIYYDDARILTLEKEPVKVSGRGKILVLSAGTSDIPIAKEAYLTAKIMGNDVTGVYDVGVAGIHRLFEYKDLINSASVLIVVAGMEGALPSVVAGLVNRPVIAVPTSIGYGVSFGGLTALFAMLNSCASNVAVVNIDNGFGAGYMASMINNL